MAESIIKIYGFSGLFRKDIFQKYVKSEKNGLTCLCSIVHNDYDLSFFHDDNRTSLIVNYDCMEIHIAGKTKDVGLTKNKLETFFEEDLEEPIQEVSS